jgi:hypothetical protein
MVIACARHRLICRLGSLLFVLAKSNQKPLSSKGSLFFDLRLWCILGGASDFTFRHFADLSLF